MNQTTKRNKSRFWIRLLSFIFFILIISGAITGYFAYQAVFAPNVDDRKESYLVQIPTGTDFEGFMQIINEKDILINTATFKWVAEQMNYTNRVQPGKYQIESGMSNRQLVHLLRSGQQQPVNVVINVVRTKELLAGRVSTFIEADSTEILKRLNDEAFLSNFGLNPDNALTLIIPNTYQFYWNTSAEGFFNRMNREFNAFWNEERLAKADAIQLTPVEVSILASIVEEESRMAAERPRIAGVYLNRLSRGWKLEADPTVKFAIGDFAIRRVLFRHLEYDSPYNTYKYPGLPPGPICIPSAQAIDAVLNAESHDYMFFSAKEDFSGYHNFARTLREHNANARRFHQELNRRNIYR